MRRSASELRERLGGLTDRLERLSPISDQERRKVCGLWREVRELSPRSRLPEDCAVGFMVSGWACHRRTLPRGGRQIIGFLTPGDSSRSAVDAAAEAPDRICLTHVQFVDVSTLFDGPLSAADHPGLTHALLLSERRAHDFLVNHIMRLATRDAKSGLAHLILELEARTAPGGDEDWFALPIGQRPIGHAMGFSTVHVNKTLAKLRDAGLLEIRGGRARVLDREGLETLAAG